MNFFNLLKTAVLGTTLALSATVIANAAPIAVTIDETPIYTSMDLAGDISSVLARGEEIQVLDIDGDWTLVSNGEAESAFVTTKSLDFVQVDAIVNVDAVNVRTKPSTKGKILGCLTKGEIVQVTAKVGDWYAVIYNGEKAYMCGKYIESDKLSLLKEEEFIDDISLGEEIAEFAVQFIGTPYVWGGTSLTKGVDCSGFTQSVYKEFGYSINRVAGEQFYNGVKVEKSELQPGDLIFFSGTPGSTYITHVVMYIGDGNFVHSSTPESGGVRIDSLNVKYFASRYVGARRII